MERTFAALRFCEDENIADRVYWYLCEFPAEAGEKVLAPVGAHNRLQCARVERTLSADEEDAPYDMRFIKKVAEKFGAREACLAGYPCRDMGGLCYDGKHYTRFGEVYYGGILPSEEQLGAIRASGIAVIHAGVEVVPPNGSVLICGAGAKETAKRVFGVVCGDTDCTQEEFLLWRKKLT